jgi:thiol-disulfide isomerase/thioredoxin
MKMILVGMALTLGLFLMGCPGDSGEAPATEDGLPTPIKQKPSVVHYYVPGCDGCEKIEPLLDDLEKTFGDDIDFKRRDATDDKFEKALQQAGAKDGHRIAILAHDGFPRYVEGEAHEGNRDLLVEKLRETLHRPPGERAEEGG